MKKMYIEDAVNYCLNHKAVIHTPTKDIYNSLMSYLDETDIKWKGGNIPSSFSFRDRRVDDICINFSTNIISYAEPDYYTNEGYEIIELTSKSVSIDGISYTNKDKAISKIESIFSSFPSAGDTYYYIDIDGEVCHKYYADDEFDKSLLAIGNIYKTKEEAESALDRVIKAYKG